MKISMVFWKKIDIFLIFMYCQITETTIINLTTVFNVNDIALMLLLLTLNVLFHN